MPLYAVNDFLPQVHPSAWVAPSAEIMGQVLVQADASVWFGCVVRGDVERIRIGAGANVQDLSVLHADPGAPLTIGEESLIGIGAVVLNGARIGRHCLVGAGALVTEGKEFPDGSLIIGSPARVARALTPEQIEGLRRSAQHYIDNARRFRATLRDLTPHPQSRADCLP